MISLNVHSTNLKKIGIKHHIKMPMFCFSLDERKEELMHMNIALDGMDGGASALEEAATALSESEAVYERVLQLTTRITVELRTKVKELQSFSPDELGNIPRKRKVPAAVSNVR